MDRFDLNDMTACSAAARNLAAEEDQLTTAMETARLHEIRLAMQMSKPRIVEASQKAGLAVKPNQPKEALAAAYAARLVQDTDDARRLAALQDAYLRDKAAARRLNSYLDRADRAVADVIRLVTYGDEWDASRAVSNLGDEMMTSYAAARLARRVLSLTQAENGQELREAIMDVAEDAMFTIMTFPRHIAVNGSIHRFDPVAEAVAAADFVQHVAGQVAGDTVPAEWLTRWLCP